MLSFATSSFGVPGTCCGSVVMVAMVLANCSSLFHNSLYNRSSFGYSPSKACLMNGDAKVEKKLPVNLSHSKCKFAMFVLVYNFFAHA